MTNKFPFSLNVYYSYLNFFFSINQGLLVSHKGAVKLQLCFDFCCWFLFGIGIERGGASKVDLGDK